MKKLWFKAKHYGRGWYPASWEGWLVTLVYAGLIIALASSVDEDAPVREGAFMVVLPIVILTVAFIRIAYKTGEKPQRRWGKKKDSK